MHDSFLDRQSIYHWIRKKNKEDIKNYDMTYNGQLQDGWKKYYLCP
jgi:hypothetical protein